MTERSKSHQPPKILLNSNGNSKDVSPNSTRFSSPSRPISPPHQRLIINNNNSHNINTRPGYKAVKIDSDLVSHERRLRKSVSFNTVAINYASGGDEKDDDYYYTHDDFDFDDDDDLLDRQYGVDLKDRSKSPLRSQSPAPLFLNNAFRSKISDIDGGIGRFKNDWRKDYPSAPAVKTDSYTSVLKHPLYTKFIETHQERTLMIYITGRHHTWVALDFLVGKLLKDGDHLVIVSRVPSSYRAEIEERSIANQEDYFQDKKISPNIFNKASLELERYVEFISNPKTIFKLTLDLFLNDSTTDVLREVIDIYGPELLVSATKPNLRFKRTTTWKTSRITDRLVSRYDLPILIVPSLLMDKFEIEFFEKITQTKNLESNLSRIRAKLHQLDLGDTTASNISKKSASPPVSADANDGSEVSSIVSTESESSTSSSIKNLTRTISEYRDILGQQVDDIDESIAHKDSFWQKINKVSDISKTMAKKFTDVSQRDGEGANLVRTLTGLPQLEKQKSMLDVLQNSGESEAVINLKKSLTGMKIGGNQSAPNSGYKSTSGVSTPKTIKFSNDASTPEVLKKKRAEDLADLRRFKSNVEVTKQERPDPLKPSKSHDSSSLSKTVSESKTKKKRNFFKSLFGKE